MCVILGCGVVHFVRPLGRPFTPGGDVAFMELGVRQALQHGDALGVYSRFGWHHPGPALLYLMVPAYWLSGDSSRSLFLSAWLINFGSALAAVLIVRRHADEWAARVFVIAIACWLLILGFRYIEDPWNPRMLALPVVLLMVSAAAAYGGSAWAFVLALGVASYLVQAHIGTLPISAALLFLAFVGFVQVERRRRSRPRHSSRTALLVPTILAIAVIGVMWVGPVVQEVGNHDGNLTRVVEFYLYPDHSGPTAHSLSSSVAVVSDVSTVVPLGAPRDQNGHSSRIFTAAAFALLGVAVAVGGRRRSRFVAGLGLTTAIGFTVAVVAATRVVGPQDTYLFYWTEGLPLPAVGAASWLVLDWFRRRSEGVTTGIGAVGAVGSGYRTAVSALTAVVVVVLVGFSVRDVAHGITVAFGDDPAARTVAQKVEQAMEMKRSPFVLRREVRGVDLGAVAVELDKAGYRFRLNRPLDLYGGNVRAPVQGPIFVLGPSAATVGTRGTPARAGRLVATVGQVDIFELPAGSARSARPTLSSPVDGSKRSARELRR